MADCNLPYPGGSIRELIRGGPSYCRKRFVVATSPATRVVLTRNGSSYTLAADLAPDGGSIVGYSEITMILCFRLWCE